MVKSLQFFSSGYLTSQAKLWYVRGLTKVCNPEQDGDANPEICYCQFSKKTVLSPIGLAGKFQVNENSRFIPNAFYMTYYWTEID